MPKAKNDIQDMSINDPQQNISVKITFYVNILKQSILDFFWELPTYHALHRKKICSNINSAKKSFSRVKIGVLEFIIQGRSINAKKHNNQITTPKQYFGGTDLHSYPYFVTPPPLHHERKVV